MSGISFRSVIACLLLTCAIGAIAAGQDKFQDRRQWIDPKTQTTDDPRRIPMPAGPRGPEGVIVLRGGRIFDGTGAPVREGTLVIRRNKIEKILPAGSVDWPKEARVIDASGKTVLPGLIDGHTHMDYAMPETPPGMSSSEADAMLRALERTRYFLECGITSIRDVGSLRNVPFRLKDWVTQNRVPAPRIFAAGAFITSTGGHGMEGSDPGDPDTGSFRVAEGADGWRQAIREQFTRGADFIKIGSHFSREEVKAAVEEAHSLGLKVGCDAETFYIQWAVEAGADSIEHPLPRTDEAIKLMAAKGTRAVPTLVPYIYIFDQWGGYFGSTSRRFTFSKEANLDVLRRMKRAGIKMGIGTDLVIDWYRYMPHPYITELKSFVEAGYSIPEALTAATRTNAEILDISDKLGTLEPGKLADVTIVDGKPDLNLDDLAKVDLVIRDGTVVVEGGRVVVPRHVSVVPPQPSADDAAKVTRLADEYVREYIARYPEVATFEGLPGAPDDKLSDNSLAALQAWQAKEDRWLAELASVDGTALWGRPEWVTYGFLREALEGSKATRIARAELWPVNQMSGWQVGLAQLASIQPVGTAVKRENALARWRQVPRYLDTEISNLKEGLRLGYSTPKLNVELTIAQLEAVLATPVRESPFFAPAARDAGPEFKAAWENLLAGEIIPAVRRYRDYLKQEYLPKARTTIAMADLPNGAAAYRAMIRASTTLDRTAEETYRLGEQAVARYEAEAAEIGRKLYGGLDLKAVVKKMAEDPANHFKSREDLMAFSKQAVDRARRAMPAWFDFVPKAQVVIEPVPAYLEQTASNAYESAASDGSRPGVYRINLYQPEAQSRATVELTAFHETYPGHHFQISVAKELPQAHMITRVVGSGSYVEGWARYSEALAEEMGLFSTDFARINRRVWPAHGMVVDPGLHVMGWSRERAINYVLSTGRFSPHEAEALVDRVIAWPAQLTTYDTGGLEFFALRAKAEKALGPKFDIKAFHSEVLKYGAVTLPMLREIVDHWIAARTK